MLTSFSAENFRGLRELTIKPLSRVNLITGMNNVGKTALLEALFLHLGPHNPQLPFTIGLLRGFQQFAQEAETTWGWLFSHKRMNRSIKLTSRSSDNITRTLEIGPGQPEQLRTITSGNGKIDAENITGSASTIASYHELVLDYQDSTGRTSTARARVSNNEISIETANVPVFSAGFFLTTKHRFSKDDAERFSNLERVNRHDEIVRTMKIIEPRLNRLAVLVSGGEPIIGGDVGLGELVPMQLMGEGTARLLSFILAILNAPQGMVLIDEIENGLHHSVLIDVWKAIGQAAESVDAQVFATTHSWECIQAAHQAFAETEAHNFALHRLERSGNDVKAITYDRESLDGAIKFGLETR